MTGGPQPRAAHGERGGGEQQQRHHRQKRQRVAGLGGRGLGGRGLARRGLLRPLGVERQVRGHRCREVVGLLAFPVREPAAELSAVGRGVGRLEGRLAVDLDALEEAERHLVVDSPFEREGQRIRRALRPGLA